MRISFSFCSCWRVLSLLRTYNLPHTHKSQVTAAGRRWHQCPGSAHSDVSRRCSRVTIQRSERKRTLTLQVYFQHQEAYLIQQAIIWLYDESFSSTFLSSWLRLPFSTLAHYVGVVFAQWLSRCFSVCQPWSFKNSPIPAAWLRSYRMLSSLASGDQFKADPASLEVRCPDFSQPRLPVSGDKNGPSFLVKGGHHSRGGFISYQQSVPLMCPLVLASFAQRYASKIHVLCSVANIFLNWALQH